jgi:hypothetical protein
MIAGAIALILLAVAAFMIKRWFDAGERELAAEITKLGLDPRYAELRAQHAAGKITFEHMVVLRQLELQAARVIKEMAAANVPAGQAAVIEPQNPNDRAAFDLLAERGYCKAMPDGKFAWTGKP